MKILVIGLGSIGKRHVRLLKDLGAEVWGSDRDGAICEAVSREFGIGTHPAPEAILQAHRVDGAIVATPTHTHRQVAYRVAAFGVRTILVEKPLAHTWSEAYPLEAEVATCGAKVLVGYCLRFHPGLQRLKGLLDSGAIGKPLSARVWFGHYLPDWHPGQDYRKWYSCRKAEGGGVLMDASHELDYCSWLLGEPVSVSATLQNTGTLDGLDCEDVADVNPTFANGAQAAVHVDYLRRRYSRGCEIVGTDGALTWDFGYSHPVTEVPVVGDLVWVKHDFATRTIEPDDMYRAELQHFLAVCRGEVEPLVTGADGVRAVRIVEAARESAATGRVVKL